MHPSLPLPGIAEGDDTRTRVVQYQSISYEALNQTKGRSRLDYMNDWCHALQMVYDCINSTNQAVQHFALLLLIYSQEPTVPRLRY